MSVDRDIDFTAVRRSLEAANTARQLQTVAFEKFQVHAQAGNWSEAEEARAEIIGHTEAYLDHLMAAHKMARND